MLNATFEPLCVVSSRRAVVLVLTEKAVPVEEGEGCFHSVTTAVRVPSVLRRTAGFDVPDFLAAGPRDVLVPQSGVTTAREVLLEAELIGPESRPSPVAPVRLLVGLLAALGVGALVIWGISALLR